MNNQKGFTLIELVIVIVILGILAATALPRFADLTGDAELAARDGILGGVRSASAIAHAQSIVDRSTDAPTTTITAEGVAIDMVFGYPAGTSGGIGAMLDTGLTPTVGGCTVTWSISTDCTVSYTQPAAVNTSPTIATDAGTCNP